MPNFPAAWSSNTQMRCHKTDLNISIYCLYNIRLYSSCQYIPYQNISNESRRSYTYLFILFYVSFYNYQYLIFYSNFIWIRIKHYTNALWMYHPASSVWGPSDTNFLRNISSSFGGKISYQEHWNKLKLWNWSMNILSEVSEVNFSLSLPSH